MSKKHLACYPHKVAGREDIWWYEENGGIYLVWEPQSQTATQHATISWSALRHAIARKDRAH